jgi:peptide/nickel transport system substrate-binding protein
MFRVVRLTPRRLAGLLLGLTAVTLTLVGFAGAAPGTNPGRFSAQPAGMGFTSAPSSPSSLLYSGASRSAATYPRKTSLITDGTQWGPIAGLNPYFGSYAVGTVGLCNETLLRYDPLKDRYINWLAKSAGFTAKKVYTVEVRPGIRWSNGQKFTGKDVRFNFRLGRFSNAFWHDLYKSLTSIEVKGSTVRFAFKATPNYIQWQHLIWNLPMVNPGQARTIRGAASLEAFGAEQVPIGTGPYELDPAGYDPTIRVVWKKKADWWAARQKLSPSPKPTYVIDLVAGNCWDLCWFPGSFQDLDNNYIPGITQYVSRGKAQTYYSKAPYFLSANTSWLTPNTTHKPLDDPAFRRALATSIDTRNIVKNDYRETVLKANATGLLPTWKKWIDRAQVQALGFKFDTAKAKSILAAAGYKDVNADGYVENKDGSKLELSIAVPSGWSDWELAENMIVNSTKAAGIRVTTKVGDYNSYQKARNSGTFDLVIDNTPQLSDSPWTYFDFLFHLPVRGDQTSANFSRYSNPAAWALTRKLGKTPPGKTAARKSIAKKLEKIALTDVPNIPLWYNGLWSQSQSKYWTNWPSSSSSRNYTPVMWRGYMQMTAIDMITHLKPGPGADGSQ